MMPCAQPWTRTRARLFSGRTWPLAAYSVALWVCAKISEMAGSLIRPCASKGSPALGSGMPRWGRQQLPRFNLLIIFSRLLISSLTRPPNFGTAPAINSIVGA
ncbi:Hypothetical protein NocV09_01000370 [Nannochloropsis oceanica]